MRNEGVQRLISCGFNAGYSRLTCKCNRCPNTLRSGAVHDYPIVCPPPKTITIDRIAAFSGVENALFFVGDVEGFRMDRNYVVEMPGDAVGFATGNFPAYLLLKDGNLHTLGFSTAYIEEVLRQNCHMFSRDGIRFVSPTLGELAPQDQAVEGGFVNGDACGCKPPEREFRSRVISNTTLNDCSTTIEITIFECEQLIDNLNLVA